MDYVIWVLVCLAIGFVGGAVGTVVFIHKKTDGEIWDAISLFQGSDREPVEPDYDEEDTGFDYGRSTRRAPRGDTLL